MNKRTLAFLRFGETIAVATAIWVFGWLIFSQLKLWQHITNLDFQNILMLLIALTMLIGSELTRRILNQSQNIKPETNKTANPDNPNIQELQTKLEEISEKLTDFHAFFQVMKKRQPPTKIQEKAFSDQTFLPAKKSTDEKEPVSRQAGADPDPGGVR